MTAMTYEIAMAAVLFPILYGELFDNGDTTHD